MTGLGCRQPFAHEVTAVRSIAVGCVAASASDPPIPPTLNARDWLTIENQGGFSSCCGFAFDQARQFDAWAQSGFKTKPPNFSARASYLFGREWAGQNADGDNGLSIQAGAMGAKEFGTVLETEFPYWNGGRFDPRIPQEIIDKAKSHKIGAVAPANSAREIVNRLGTGQGATGWGITWTTGWRDYSGGPINRLPGGRVLGGHATALVDYVTIDGELYLIGANSHGTEFGDRGYYTIHVDLVDQILDREPFGAYTVTALDGFEKRPFRWERSMG